MHRAVFQKSTQRSKDELRCVRILAQILGEQTHQELDNRQANHLQGGIAHPTHAPGWGSW